MKYTTVDKPPSFILDEVSRTEAIFRRLIDQSLLRRWHLLTLKERAELTESILKAQGWTLSLGSIAAVIEAEELLFSPSAGMNQEKGASHWLGELLAVIHGDGGHYQAVHGQEKATNDAITVVLTLRQTTAENRAPP